MAGQINIAGTSGSVQLFGNDTIVTDINIYFPPAGGLLFANGNALEATTGDFSGDVQIGGDPHENTGIDLRTIGIVKVARTGTDSVWAGYTTGNGKATSEISADGNITVAGSISAAGSATLGPDWGYDQSIFIDDGQVLVRQDNDSQVFGVYYGGSAASNNTLSITGNGTITAAGSATFGNYNSQDENSGGVQIKSSGAITLNGAAGADDDVSLFIGYKTSATGSLSSVFSVNNGGDAKFEGTVTSNGNVLTLSSGDLDVGDRLKKADDALKALKAAAAASSDFASLKAAIASALSNI